MKMYLMHLRCRVNSTHKLAWYELVEFVINIHLRDIIVKIVNRAFFLSKTITLTLMQESDRMKFSFPGFGFELTPEEAYEMAHFLSNVIHKEKNSICTLLNFSGEFLRGWYDEANHAFTPVIDQGGFKRLTEKKRTDILEFITGTICVEIADTLETGFRRQILEREPGEVAKIIKGQEDLERINKICSNIETFKNFVKEKQQWYNDITDSVVYKDINVENLKQWRSKLYEIVLDTNRTLLNIKPNLGCKQNDIKNLGMKWLSRNR